MTSISQKKTQALKTLFTRDPGYKREENVRTQRCQRCNQRLPVHLFHTPDDNVHKREHCCRVCSWVRNARENREWDWASSMLRSTRLSLKRHQPGNQVCKLSAEMLRHLMELQHYQCAWLGLQLCLPHKLHTGMSLNKWAQVEKLPDVDAAQIPILVRADRAVGWIPGNVIFICRSLKPFYDHMMTRFASVMAVGTILRATPKIPDRESLNKLYTEEEQKLRESALYELTREGDESYKYAK